MHSLLGSESCRGWLDLLIPSKDLGRSARVLFFLLRMVPEVDVTSTPLPATNVRPVRCRHVLFSFAIGKVSSADAYFCNPCGLWRRSRRSRRRRRGETKCGLVMHVLEEPKSRERSLELLKCAPRIPGSLASILRPASIFVRSILSPSAVCF